MHLRSFRLRLALLSVLLSGLVLGAFALLAWALVGRLALERVDEQLGAEGRHVLFGPHPPDGWSRLARAPQFAQRDTAPPPFILLVKGQDGAVLTKSAAWPDDLPPSLFVSLPVADLPAPPAPPAPQNPPGTQNPPGPGGPPGPPPGDGSPPAWHGEGPPPPPPMVPIRFDIRRAGGQRWRLATTASREATVVIGASLDTAQAQMAPMRNALLTALPVALLLIGAAAWLLSGRALRPVQVLTHAAEQVTARGLDQRIAYQDADAEFVGLITVFNEMLDRLERSFHQAVRFSADAAHELRTPLTVLQGELEGAIQAAEAGSDDQRRYTALLEEVQRLSTIVRNLLLLSRADAGQLRLNPTLCDLTSAVSEIVEDTEALAPHLAVSAELAPEVWANADPELLGLILRNLATNAAKYSHDQGQVQFRLRTVGPTAELAVSNNGPPIRREDRERIFDRFYRGDQSRSRTKDGVGLGLSLSRELARAHGGDLVLAESRRGMTTFVLTLPAAPRGG